MLSCCPKKTLLVSTQSTLLTLLCQSHTHTHTVDKDLFGYFIFPPTHSIPLHNHQCKNTYNP